MARAPLDVHNNMVLGEVDPRMHERHDDELYSRGLLSAENCIVQPTGGVTRRAGTELYGRTRRLLRQISPSHLTLAVPGGTIPGYLLDGDTSTVFETNSGPGASDLVVFEAAFDQAFDLMAVDLQSFATVSGKENGAALVLETKLDDGDWEAFGDPLGISSLIRARRTALPPGQVRNCTQLRLVAKANTGIGAIRINNLFMWTETGVLSEVREVEFVFSEAQSYQLVVTDRHVDIYRNAAWQACAFIPHRSDQLSELTYAQSRDTLLLFHREAPPYKLLRQGAHDEWHWTLQAFSNIPSLGGSTSAVDGKAEVQLIEIDLTDVLDKALVITIEQYDTEAVLIDSGTLAQDIVDIIEALPNIDADRINVSLEDNTQDKLTFAVKFLGNNADRFWPAIIANVVEADVGVSTTYGDTVAVFKGSARQDGVPSSGVLMSSSTGWPRCGAFYQGRLLLGGFALRPDTLLVSVANSPFDFQKTSSLGAAAGMELTFEAKKAETILHIHAGRRVHILTNVAEWYIDARALDATQVPPFVRTTSFGSKAGVTPRDVEGVVVFTQKDGKGARDFLYSDQEKDYTSGLLTLWSSHLVPDAISMAHREAVGVDEASQLWLINSDGSVALTVLMRERAVRGVTPIKTDGLVRSIGIDRADVLSWVCQRNYNGRQENLLEFMKSDLVLDCATRFAFETASDTIAGLDHFEGREVWAVADGSIFGPFTVTGGEITLPIEASEGYTGLKSDWSLAPLPPRFKDKYGRYVRRPNRVVSSVLALDDTTSLEIAANGGSSSEVALRELNGGLALDAPELDNAFSGDAIVDRLYGHDISATVTLTQPRPGRATVRAIYMEVR